MNQNNTKAIKLRDYQFEGIKKIKEVKNFGLFWQQRLGKTIVSIKAVENYKKIIFAVPNNILFTWENEIRLNTTNINYQIMPRLKTKRLAVYQDFNTAKQMWLICSYDVLSSDFKNDHLILNNFDYIVLDEGHFLRNRKTKRSKMMLLVRGKAKYALVLTGTPAVNNAIDILRIFNFLYPEEKFSQRYRYKIKYFLPNPDPNCRDFLLNPKHKDEWERLVKQYSDIKKVHDYLKWLPKTIEKDFFVEMKSEQKKHYKKMLLESKRILTNNNKEKIETKVFVQMMRLQQISLDPRLIDIEAASTKVEWLESYLDKTLQNSDEYIIVFTNFTSLFQKWNFKLNEKYSIDYLTGLQSADQKQKTIENFQNKKTRVLFANIKVAGQGLTLDIATITIFLNKSWSPVDNEQASFRMVDTIERNNLVSKLIINLIAKDTIDERIIQVLKDKKTKTDIIYEIKKYIEES